MLYGIEVYMKPLVATFVGREANSENGRVTRARARLSR